MAHNEEVFSNASVTSCTARVVRHRPCNRRISIRGQQELLAAMPLLAIIWSSFEPFPLCTTLSLTLLSLARKRCNQSMRKFQQVRSGRLQVKSSKYVVDGGAY